MRPVDIPTAETADFIQTHVHHRGHILEVGCGEGEVAFALIRQGYEVTAVDSDPERVIKARARGVRASVASWPDFDIAAVDAIAFTRSLHHINPVADAIDRARLLLKPDGILVVEDFAVEMVDEETLNWFRQMLRSEPLISTVEPAPESFVSDLLATDNVVRLWHDHHTTHGVHLFSEMLKPIADRFPDCHVQSMPYLYRYVVSALPDTDKWAHLASEFLQRETEAIETHAITPIGRRIVARTAG